MVKRTRRRRKGTIKIDRRKGTEKPERRKSKNEEDNGYKKSAKGLGEVCGRKQKGKR